MRAAFRKWQFSNDRLSASLEELNHQYLALVNKAAIFPIDKQQGVLRVASHILNQPMDNETQRLRERLNQAFRFFGRSFFRRPPTSLQLDIFQYDDRIREICLKLGCLAAKLRLARKILDVLQHNKKVVSPAYLNRAMLNPEAVWMTLLLQQRYRLMRQKFEICLNNSRQAKLAACQNWLKLLQPYLSYETMKEYTQNLDKIKNLTCNSAAPGSTTTLHQLDLCSDLAQSLASEVISVPPDKH